METDGNQQRKDKDPSGSGYRGSRVVLTDMLGDDGGGVDREDVARV